MNVKELIEWLSAFHDDLPVYVRKEDTGDFCDYWLLTGQDVQGGDIRKGDTDEEFPAVIIGDDRV